MRACYIIGVLIFFFLSNCDGQYDERFYFPKKESKFPDTLNVLEIPIKVEHDTIYIQFLKPSVTSQSHSILYFHGAGGNSSQYISLIEPFLNQGFEVFMVDFRGYGQSSGTPTHQNIARDAQVVLDSLLVLGNKSIICYGASIGTQIAAHLTLNNQPHIAALVLDCPMSSFTDIAVHSSPEALKDIVGQVVTSPYAAKDDIKLINSIPILVLHGNMDASIPLSQGQLVFDNAISAEKQWWAYEGDHLEAALLYKEELLSRVLKMIQ